MHTDVDEFLAARAGVATRAQLRSLLTRNQLDHEVASGYLVAPFPRTYCRPWDADMPAVRARAAVLSVGQPVALSHVTALAAWDLPGPATGLIHVTVPTSRHPIGRMPSLVVHRTRVPTAVQEVGGLPTVEPAVAIVRSWPLTEGSDQRAAAIEAVRRGLVTPTELRTAAERAVGMRGRARLIRLTGLLDVGCESELEVWGFTKVFDFPGLRHGVRQKVVVAGGRRYRLDLAYEQERVAVELDGYRYHSAREQRERDMRRDAALASIGWITVRFSHERLHRDVAGCRNDLLAVLATRPR